VTELRLNRALYAESAIDEAVATFAAHAEIARAEEGELIVLAISSERAGRAERVAKELANFALGLTIQARGGAAGVGA
jgi:hypothetical protein